jgi:vacuolar-type H+-ATPase catalytic subunit A/Vma1
MTDNDTQITIWCSILGIVYERKYEYVKVSEDELYGRIIRLALDGFFG